MASSRMDFTQPTTSISGGANGGREPGSFTLFNGAELPPFRFVTSVAHET